MGWLAPVATTSPDGTLIAYNTWHHLVPVDSYKSYSQQGLAPGDALGFPSIRIFDTATGSDEPFEEGAFSLAWRFDGAMGYFKGLRRDDRVAEPYLGTVMVRPVLDAPAVPWTVEPARYIVVAWAGERLIVYREHEGENLELLALDGPGQVRRLAPGGTLVALSPDGELAAVEYTGGMGGYLVIVRVADGHELAAMDLSKAADSLTGVSPRFLSYGGSWVGDRIVAEAGTGVAVFRFRDGNLTLSRVLPLTPQPFPMGVHEPQLLGPTGDRIVAWAPVHGQGGDAPGRLYVYLDCSLQEWSCTAGPARGDPNFYQIYNPSRPLQS